MKSVLVALAIAALFLPIASRATAPDDTTEPETPALEATAPQATEVVCARADTLARDLGGRYEGPNSSEFPHPDPPCPPGG